MTWLTRSALMIAALFVAAPAAAVPLACGQAANTLEGGPGTTITVTCPANCTDGSVWGTTTYSDDSSICTAAVHAGAISRAAGGTFDITIAPGADQYVSSTANGVSTSEWGSWGRSFIVGGSGAPTVDCHTAATSLGGDPGSAVRVTCPAGCASGGTVWGTGTYSDDSAVCTAAIHAGVLSNAGGSFEIRIQAGQSSYESSTLNGVTTAEWGSWGRSFTVAP